MHNRLLPLLLLLLLPAASATAGKLYAREPGRASPLYNLRQVNVDTRVTIHDRLAVTHVDETFSNATMYELEGWYVFELPDGATMDGLWMWVDGERHTFIVKRKEEAQQLYDSLTHNNIGDPAILETLDGNRFQLRVFPIRPGEDRRIEIQYFELLPVNTDGTIRYAYPLNMSGYQASTVEQLFLNVDLHMAAPVKQTTTNFDDRPLMTSRITHGPRHVTVQVQHEDIVLQEDFVLEYQLEGWADSLFVLTCGDASPDSSTFITWFPDTLDVSEDIKTDFVFAIDASGSMTGLRGTMVIEAMSRVLSRLLPCDRFHLLLFNAETRHFPADTAMVFATPASILAAQHMLSTLYSPRGITDYDIALSPIAELALRPDAGTRVIFITDGMPNRGSCGAQDLLPYFQTGSRNIVFHPITIYSEQVGVMHELAELTGGALCALEQGLDIEDALRRTTFGFESQLVEDVWLEYPSGVADVYPRAPATGGLQSTVGTGRFTPDVQGNCQLHFRLPGTTHVHTVSRPVALHTDTLAPVQVARYWAAQRIRDLLQMLVDVEDSTEIREAVIRLSEKYMLLTPFTAFIVYHEVDDPTSAGELALPEQLRLEQNYPNPFNPRTTIRFTIPQRGDGGARRVRLVIYDMLGRLVTVLSDADYSPGTYTLTWDGVDSAGQGVSSGRYFAVLHYGNERATISMTLLK